jgi:hypothetical protein
MRQAVHAVAPDPAVGTPPERSEGAGTRDDPLRVAAPGWGPSSNQGRAAT